MIKPDLYIYTHSESKFEINDDGETTYYIDGEYSFGDEWIPCTIIWNGEMKK